MHFQLILCLLLFSMGSSQSSKLHCNRYLDGKGPPSLEQQVNDAITRSSSQSCQPEGQMTWVVLQKELPGYPNVNTLEVKYIFQDGIQMDKHPHPGQPFAKQTLLAYLPDNSEGRKVLKLLQKAFDQEILFTIATSETGEDMIKSTSIPLKTRSEGGTIVNGYPDMNYLKTVRKGLKNKGIV